MGFEGANVLFDTWVHPLMMGLEEHLLAMFRDDFEFGGDASPSHLGAATAAKPQPVAETQPQPFVAPVSQIEIAIPLASSNGTAAWAADAESELKKIPFFVRGKARRNTERFAQERGLSTITIETLYDAKAHFSR